MLKVEIPSDKDKITRQIKALEYQLTQDTNKKDTEIHQQALEELRKALSNK